MNPDTAELAIVESAGERALPLNSPGGSVAAAGAVPAEGARRTASLRRFASRTLRLGELDAGQLTAVRDSWRALWSSRLLVFVAGVVTVVRFGFGPARNAFNPPGVTRGFGRLGDILAAPVARWDSAWYLVIAHCGYEPSLGALTATRTAFFPLYPLVLRAVAFG